MTTDERICSSIRDTNLQVKVLRDVVGIHDGGEVNTDDLYSISRCNVI